jgi:hypothetical protein
VTHIFDTEAEMTETVYVETSIPSFYHEARTEPEMIVRREWTRRWWKVAQERYELVTSPLSWMSSSGVTIPAVRNASS